jgi:hypothetical protein
MQAFIPKRLEPVAFAFLLSGIQTFVITGISTALAVGFSSELPALWVKAYFSSWIIAFPGVLVVAPLVKRILHRAVIA